MSKTEAAREENWVGVPSGNPVLPYGTAAPSSGYSGSTTSEAAVRAQDADGRTADKQAQALHRLGLRWFVGPDARVVGQVRGMTWQELDSLEKWGHGSTSRVLSDLHKAGRIARLTLEREHCKVYVLPEHVNGREVEAHGGKRAAALVEAEAAIQRVRDLHQDDGQHDGLWKQCPQDGEPVPCSTIRALDGTTEKRSS